MKRAFLALSSAFVIGAMAFPAHAYTFIFDLGCPPNQGGSWKQVSEWYLHTSGYSKLPMEEVEQIFVDSMDVWGSPCCSDWQHQYLGTTTGSAVDSRDDRHIIQFAETQSAWPREFGATNSTIAVTLPRQGGACNIVGADMLFNAVGFTFDTQGERTDLQSIATHEAGHWVGLDHSTAQGSTMQAFYRGGTSGRNLVPDDEAGVCGLYPKDSCGCEETSDCSPGQECVDGSCSRATCETDAECPSGSFCWEGSCLPGCTDDSECGNEQVCRKNSCIPDPEICVICNECTPSRYGTSAECGPWQEGYYCLGTMQGNRCTKECRSTADCDGDSVCRTVSDGQGNEFNFCFAQDEGDACPDGYQCVGAPEGPGCRGLWDSCNRSGSSCHGNTDVCVDHNVDGSRCTCICTDNDDCGSGASCIKGAGGVGYCAPDGVMDRCYGVECAEGLVCNLGFCLDPCQNVSCSEGLVCDMGECVPSGTSCVGVTCDEGERCEAGVCIEVDLCVGVVCEAGQSCKAGACVDDGKGGSGGGGKRPKKSSCSTAGGDPSLLVLLLAAAPLAIRRRAV